MNRNGRSLQPLRDIEILNTNTNINDHNNNSNNNINNGGLSSIISNVTSKLMNDEKSSLTGDDESFNLDLPLMKYPSKGKIRGVEQKVIYIIVSSSEIFCSSDGLSK